MLSKANIAVNSCRIILDQSRAGLLKIKLFNPVSEGIKAHIKKLATFDFEPCAFFRVPNNPRPLWKIPAPDVTPDKFFRSIAGQYPDQK